MNNKYRIFSVLLSLVLVFCMIFPVSAYPSDYYSINWLDYCTLNDLGENYLNLSAAGYEFYYALPFKERLYKTEMLFRLTGTTNRVTSLTVVDEDDQVYEAQVLYLGSGFYRALFDCRGNGVETLTFNFELNTTLQTSISVNQLRSSASEVLYFSPRYDAFVYTIESGQDLLASYTNVNTFSTNSDEPNGLAGNESFFIKIVMSDWKKYDYIDFHFSTVAFNISSITATVNSKVSLPLEIQEVYGGNTSESTDNVYNFTVSCDLTSVPKEGVLTIEIHGNVSPELTMVYHLVAECLSCTGYISSDSFTNPLYYWLMKISSNVDSVSGIMGNVSNVLTNFKQSFTTFSQSFNNYVSTLLTNLTSQFEQTRTTIASNFGNLARFMESVLNPTNSMQPAEDLDTEIADQAGELEGISDSLNSVDKVSPDDINMDIDSFVDPSFSVNALAGLKYALGTTYILKIFTLLFTFALIGYILYGKR